VARAAADTDAAAGVISGVISSLQARAARNHRDYEDAVSACCAALERIGHSSVGKFLRDQIFDMLEVGRSASRSAPGNGSRRTTAPGVG
jgi:hypothetical protein